MLAALRSLILVVRRNCSCLFNWVNPICYHLILYLLGRMFQVGRQCTKPRFIDD